MRKRHTHAARSIQLNKSSSAPAAGGAVQADGVDREALIREAAYFLYESRGCRTGHALDDWIDAEAEIAAQFALGDTRSEDAGIEQIAGAPSEVAPV